MLFCIKSFGEIASKYVIDRKYEREADQYLINITTNPKVLKAQQNAFEEEDQLPLPPYPYMFYRHPRPIERAKYFETAQKSAVECSR